MRYGQGLQSAPWFHFGSNAGRQRTSQVLLGHGGCVWFPGVASCCVLPGGASGCLRISCSATELPRRSPEKSTTSWAACVPGPAGPPPCGSTTARGRSVLIQRSVLGSFRRGSRRRLAPPYPALRLVEDLKAAQRIWGGEPQYRKIRRMTICSPRCCEPLPRPYPGDERGGVQCGS
jgi:hypothetical protein